MLVRQAVDGMLGEIQNRARRMESAAECSSHAAALPRLIQPWLLLAVLLLLLLFLLLLLLRCCP